MARTFRVKKRRMVTRKKNQIRLPAAKIYSLAARVLKRHADKLNVNLIKEDMQGIKPPFVVLSNHSSKRDWIYVGVAMMPELLNVVITQYYYSMPKLNVLLKLVGAIPKQQFSPDVGAVKNILAVAAKGGNIMLFPEGRTTPSGESETFERSTVKLLRHLKMPVVGIHMDGSYLTMPKWNDTPRKGRVDVRVFPMMTAEQIAEMTDDEIFDRMTRSLYTDEFAWQKKNRVAFEGGECVEGLENVLFMCPKCGGEMCTRTQGDTIFCEKCGSGARQNEYYELTPLDENSVAFENISEWYKWQVRQQRRMAEENPDICMSDGAELRMLKERKWLQPVGRGVINLDRNGFTYNGDKDGEPFKLEIPLSMLPAVAFDPGCSFELYYRGEFYSFTVDTPQTSQKWSMLTEQMHSIYCTEK